MPLDPGQLLDVLLHGEGPEAIVLGLILAVVAFWRGWVRPGKDSQEWHDVAEKYGDTLASLLPTLDRMSDTLDAIVEAQQDLQRTHEIESEVRRIMGGRNGGGDERQP